MRRGDHCLDLGYFLQGALTIDDRRAAEDDLLVHYHSSLDVPADTRPSLDAIRLRYRASVTHGLTVWLATSASTWQRPEVSLTLAERYAAAFVDLDSGAALDALDAAG